MASSDTVWPQQVESYELFEVIRESPNHKIYKAICKFDQDDDRRPREVAIKIVDADILTIQQIETMRVRQKYPLSPLSGRTMVSHLLS